MPKRSNEFQRLITCIYEQLAPLGASVTESALFPDADPDAVTEIDVLIEFRTVQETLRIAVECRDHKRRAGKPWIRELYGKYERLPIQHVVAVSRHGFSKDALALASTLHIATKTLEEGLHSDWHKDLIELGVVRLSVQPRSESMEISSDPKWPDAGPPLSVIVSGQMDSANNFMRTVLRRIAELAWNEIVDRKIESAVDLIGRAEVSRTYNIVPQELVFRSADGTDHVVQHLSIHCMLAVSQELLPASRARFGDVGVVTAKDAQLGYEFVVIQAPGEQPRGTAFRIKTEQR